MSSSTLNFIAISDGRSREMDIIDMALASPIYILGKRSRFGATNPAHESFPWLVPLTNAQLTSFVRVRRDLFNIAMAR